MTLDEAAPRVCVIIAAKDAERTIARAVASALAQPEAAEVVVVDDGSTDRTADVARAQDDGQGRLRVLVSARNEGPAAARNRAVAASLSPLVCALDADDHMQPGRLRRLLALGGDDWDLLADDLLVAEEGREDGPYHTLLDADPEPGFVLSLAAFVRGCISRPDRPRRELGFLKPLMRRRFLQAAALGYDPAMRLSEDYALYCAALAAGARFRFVGPCGYVAVRRAESLSARHGADDLAGVLRTNQRLLERRDLAPEARAAVRDHQRALRLNFDFRRALDARRAGAWGTMLKHLLRTPATTRYILSELGRARARRRRGAAAATFGDPGRPGP